METCPDEGGMPGFGVSLLLVGDTGGSVSAKSFGPSGAGDSGWRR